MKKTNLGQTVSILANIGVISSIIFLGMEVRDNATQARVATTANVAEMISTWRYKISDDPALAAIYTTGLADYHSLSDIDKARFEQLMKAFLTTVTIAIRGRDAGLVPLTPELERRSLEGRVFMHLDFPGFRQWWEVTDKRDLVVDQISLVNELARIRSQNRLSE
ncbi:MAG: hypothetical protein GTO41_03165 [Burkholderiales bacterium]|nr:hypothetical protein [Burkholderiales bacterium]